ncbi:hypothetical protein [Bacillus phage vB_BanS-Thrax5]|nr:hypothetical protein [Bacillus phage vB_BanS-Thrax5]
MNWLKKKIRDWLGITEIENNMNKNFESLDRKHNNLLDSLLGIEDMNQALRERNEFILKNFKIAVDHTVYDNLSWAVICIDGKPEYVRFISLSNREIREIHSYLRQFDRGSRIVDSPTPYFKPQYFEL